MTEEEVSRIGAALGIALPEAYRAAMLAHPSDPTDPDAVIALLDDARAVIAFNLFLREQFAEHWRSGYFAFGNSPSGDPYFFDLGSGAEMVLSMDHESCEVTPLAPDFECWLASRPSGGVG